MWLPLPSTHSLNPRILTPPPPPSPLTTPPSSAHVHSYTASLTLFRRSYYFRHSNVRIVGGLDTQGNGAVAETALGGGAGNRVQKQKLIQFSRRSSIAGRPVVGYYQEVDQGTGVSCPLLRTLRANESIAVALPFLSSPLRNNIHVTSKIFCWSLEY